jgi:hypothetical protein
MALLDLQGMELPSNGHGGSTSSLSVAFCTGSSLSLTTCR